MNTYIHIWLYMVSYGYIWLYMVIYGYIWLYMVIYGYIYMDFVCAGSVYHKHILNLGKVESFWIPLWSIHTAQSDWDYRIFLSQVDQVDQQKRRCCPMIVWLSPFEQSGPSTFRYPGDHPNPKKNTCITSLWVVRLVYPLLWGWSTHTISIVWYLWFHYVCEVGLHKYWREQTWRCGMQSEEHTNCGNASTVQTLQSFSGT